MPTPEQAQAAITALRETATNHPGCSGGERCAWEILQCFESGRPCDFVENFVRLDSTRKQAVLTLLQSLAVGGIGLVDLR